MNQRPNRFVPVYLKSLQLCTCPITANTKVSSASSPAAAQATGPALRRTLPRKSRALNKNPNELIQYVGVDLDAEPLVPSAHSNIISRTSTVIQHYLFTMVNRLFWFNKAVRLQLLAESARVTKTPLSFLGSITSNKSLLLISYFVCTDL